MSTQNDEYYQALLKQLEENNKSNVASLDASKQAQLDSYNANKDLASTYYDNYYNQNQASLQNTLNNNKNTLENNYNYQVNQYAQQQQAQLTENDIMQQRIQKYLPQQMKGAGLSGVGYNEQTLLNANNNALAMRKSINDTYNQNVNNALQEKNNQVAQYQNAYDESIRQLANEQLSGKYQSESAYNTNKANLESDYQNNLTNENKDYYNSVLNAQQNQRNEDITQKQLEDERAYNTSERIAQQDYQKEYLDKQQTFQKEYLKEQQAYEDRVRQEEKTGQSYLSLYQSMITGGGGDADVIEKAKENGMSKNELAYLQLYSDAMKSSTLEGTTSNVISGISDGKYDDILDKLYDTVSGMIDGKTDGNNYSDTIAEQFANLTTNQLEAIRSELVLYTEDMDTFTYRDDMSAQSTQWKNGRTGSSNTTINDKQGDIIVLNYGGDTLKLKTTNDNFTKDSKIGKAMISMIEKDLGRSAQAGDIVLYYNENTKSDELYMVTSGGNLRRVKSKNTNFDSAFATLKDSFKTSTATKNAKKKQTENKE